MIFALLLLGVLPVVVLPLLGEAEGADEPGPGAAADEDMAASGHNETDATSEGGDHFDALKSDESVLSPEAADYVAPPAEPGESYASEGADTGRDIYIKAGQGDTELADFRAGEDHLTLVLDDGGTGEFTVGLTEDGTAAELSYQPLEGEGFTLRFAGHEVVPLDDIELLLSDPVTGETSGAALADLLVPADGEDDGDDTADWDGAGDDSASEDGEGDSGRGDESGDESGGDGGGEANVDPDCGTAEEPPLRPVIEPDLTGGGSDPEDVALAPVIAPDVPGPGGDEPALTPQSGDTVDAPVKGGRFDDDLDIYAGDIATGGAGQDTFWRYYDTDADVGYARITDFTVGEDMLRVTLNPAAVAEGYTVEVITTPDGLDARALVNGEIVALLQGAPGASAADVIVDSEAGA
jgi:hypothetical protein